MCAHVRRFTVARARSCAYIDAVDGRDPADRDDRRITTLKEPAAGNTSCTQYERRSYISIKMGTDRTTIRLDDERKRLFDQAATIVAADEYDEPPRSEVIDAALTHLIESRANIDDARDDLDPATIQRFNTEVLGLKYRTTIDERWR